MEKRYLLAENPHEDGSLFWLLVGAVLATLAALAYGVLQIILGIIEISVRVAVILVIIAFVLGIILAGLGVL